MRLGAVNPPIISTCVQRMNKPKCARFGMRAIFVFSLVILGLLILPGAAFGVAKTSQGSGNWNGITWSPAGNPAAGDDVTIRAGDSVTLNVASAALRSLTVNGTLTVAQTLNVNNTATAFLTINSGASVIVCNSGTARTVDVNGDLTIAASASFATGATAATHTFTLGGNLSNSGTFDCLPGAGRIINVTFNGTANQTIGGGGATTR